MTNLDEAINAAEVIGYPLVAKAIGLTHKTEHNAVKLNLNSSAELVEATSELLQLGKPVYIEAMIDDQQLELIVGISRDPQLGLVLTLGSGGILVEIMKDSATLLLPSSREDIKAALQQLRCSALFSGYRGRPAVDLQAAIESILSVQEYAINQVSTIKELDINPLIIRSEGNGAIAADALIVTGESHE